MFGYCTTSSVDVNIVRVNILFIICKRKENHMLLWSLVISGWI